MFSVLCLLCLCTRLFIWALWSPAGKGRTSWLSFVVSDCEFVTLPLVSWVRCGTWLYRFLIFAPFLTFSINNSERRKQPNTSNFKGVLNGFIDGLSLVKYHNDTALKGRQGKLSFFL